MPIRIGGAIEIGGNVEITSETGFDFSGSQWLTVTNTSGDWNLGRVWTIEFTVTIPEQPLGPQYLLSQPTVSGTSTGVDVFVDTANNGRAQVGVRTGTDRVMFTDTYISPGQQTHVAIQSFENVPYGIQSTQTWINGLRRENLNTAIGFYQSTNDLTVGRRASDNGAGFRGRLDSLRISNQAIISNTTYTPSSTLLVLPSTRLLLQGVNFTTDQSGRHTVVINS